MRRARAVAIAIAVACFVTVRLAEASVRLCARPPDGSAAEELAVWDDASDALCVDSSSSALGRSSEAACEEELMAWTCAHARGAACALSRRDESRALSGDAYERCVRPLCASDVCSSTQRRAVVGVDEAFAREFCETACGGADRARFAEMFGGTWATSSLNPLNLQSMLGAFTTGYPNVSSMIRVYLQVQSIMFVIRAISQGIMAATGGGGGGTSTPSTIYFPTPSPTSPTPAPTPTPTPTSTPTSPTSAETCGGSCGLCVYPDATSQTPTCCCDDTCFEYSDCCADVQTQCPTIGKSNRRVRARSTATARSRG